MSAQAGRLSVSNLREMPSDLYKLAWPMVDDVPVKGPIVGLVLLDEIALQGKDMLGGQMYYAQQIVDAHHATTHEIVLASACVSLSFGGSMFSRYAAIGKWFAGQGYRATWTLAVSSGHDAGRLTGIVDIVDGIREYGSISALGRTAVVLVGEPRLW